VPITNVSFVGSESLLGLLLQASKERGNDYTANLINSQVIPSYERTDLPAVREYREFMERYQPMPGPELVEGGYQPLHFSYVSFEGFLNAKLLVEIFKRMDKGLDRRHLRDTVQAIDRLDLGIDEPVSFGSTKHQGWNRVYFTTVEVGRFVPLEDWKKWAK
jgi:hypothetical protein